MMNLSANLLMWTQYLPALQIYILILLLLQKLVSLKMISTIG